MATEFSRFRNETHGSAIEVALRHGAGHPLLVSIPKIELKVRVRGRHPWFYRKMVQKPTRPLPAGCVVHVVDRDGRAIGSGLFNPRTDLALRMFSTTLIEDQKKYFVQMLKTALAMRESVLLLPSVTNAYRVIHSEADGCPGLILDRLGNAFVAQVHSLGMQNQMEPMGEWLREQVRDCKLVLLQDDDSVRREGMERLPRPQPVAVSVNEHGIHYAVQAGGGHKTGFFADQRDNRQLVRQLSKGRRVLDLCCNAGGFAMNAVAGGAKSVLASDLDEAMVAATVRNAAQNKLRVDTQHADAFDLLRELKGGEYDLIVLDPPKWVPHREEFEQGIARYRDLNRLAFQKIADGGILVTCSCSGSVSEESFLRMLQDAASEASVDARVLFLRGAGADHPAALQCLETRYLKVAVLAVSR
ncbi:MAG: class I SAM-dependent rRNA methyltransferase [Planctomycetota bacterium]|nr:class I SAM-dependent rRNA methyltransferase [Planctomycetota bacterium]MSR37953.1 class I SAM-dependent rRNA methyltransferase [Planctomycetota bacterium]